MQISQREMITLVGMTKTGLVTRSMFPNTVPQTTQPLPRVPLDEVVKSEKRLAALRKGVKGMKRRKPSNPSSWFYQVAIHDITPGAVKIAAEGDLSGNFRASIINEGSSE